MDTDNLILRLGAEVAPVDSRIVTHRLTFGLGFGIALALILLVFWQGLNPDLAGAMRREFFWMKASYCLALGVPAVFTVMQLARPDGDIGRLIWSFAVPVIVLSVFAAVELAVTPSREWLAMWLGHSWTACPWKVLALSGPIFLGLLWAFRAFAPTQLRLTGALSGLSAGAIGAAIYGLHCPETSAIFLMTWYTLGIGAAAGVGALIGPRVLRW